MKSRVRGVALGVTLAGVMLVCAISPALADTKYPSRVTLANSFPAFHGKVKSKGGEICVKGRQVRLFSERIGRDEKIGKTRTNGKGRWKIPLDPSSGVYYAKVTKGGSASLGIKCGSDASETVVID